ncbi:hypothetical protein ACWT_4835 [Actinoplanes sp. SE50]|uniref:DUF305 domain-containing protein n=1 Tax=unclassified Actinoplanes TaxID=2626549 RepID=UPI00023EC4B8|nr:MULTISPECIES: DUF305 domain-containing protein [unclassified Actinoplanes]AEV85854.1 hypothetical protein ACPL_4965 [Actinoplanes sp. SE50/110]ATO84250.1 hypothetical protein ACWT_4835 [Actinoplanes sp. SE50]SLM01660.1 hypothetical protein ACSP50_4896 [Actinoplanes sp. SE50/110]
MRTRRRLGALAAACGLAAVTACGSPTATTPPAGPPPGTPAASFGGTDIAWIQINIAMDEQLLPLLALTPSNGADTGLRAVSDQVRALSERELGTLRKLHDEAGLSGGNPHEGMPMPGMVTPAMLAAATGQHGAAFDRTLGVALREYLEQSRQLAGSEQSAGAETRTRALAASILQSRAAALGALKK